MLKNIFITISVLVTLSYSSLPKNIQADKYLLQAKKSVEERNFKKAEQYFEKILNLNIKVPNKFHYFYSKTLKEVGNCKKTIQHLDIFLNNAHNKSEYYTKALNMYTECENTITKTKAYKRFDIILEDINSYMNKLMNGSWDIDKYSKVERNGTFNIDNNCNLKIDYGEERNSLISGKTKVKNTSYIDISLRNDLGKRKIIWLYRYDGKDSYDTDSIVTELQLRFDSELVNWTRRFMGFRDKESNSREKIDVINLHISEKDHSYFLLKDGEKRLRSNLEKIGKECGFEVSY